MNSTVFEELMTASKGDGGTQYSQSPRDDDERSARLKNRAFISLLYKDIKNP